MFTLPGGGRAALSSSRLAAACLWPSIASGFLIPWPPFTNSNWQSPGNPSYKRKTMNSIGIYLLLAIKSVTVDEALNLIGIA